MSIIVCADEDRVQVVLKDHPSGSKITKDVVMNYLLQMDAIYRREKQFRVIYDTRGYTGSFPLSCLLLQAKYMNKRKAETQQYMRKCGVLVTSKVTRAAINTLFKLRKPSVQNYLVTDDVEKCLEFIKI
jgi:hypothetical protein